MDYLFSIFLLFIDQIVGLFDE